MAHQPKPFYRSARKAFYVQLGKQQIKLIAGPDDAATEKAAWVEFHKLMVARETAVHTSPSLTPCESPANPSDSAGIFVLPSAGATITMEIMDTSFGSRSFKCEDPEGHPWTFGE